MVNVYTRYDKRVVAGLVGQLEAWIESTEETLSNAEDANNEERIDMLSERLENLEAARDALQNIIDA